MKHPNDHYYLVEVQYLGFRYHGWQKQPQVKTVQGMIEKTIKYIRPGKPFKLIGSSRTDAMVSAEHAAFQLIVREALDLDEFIQLMNINLPPDIRILDASSISSEFNIIQHAKSKHYRYFFAYGSRFHPFCAPYLAFIHGTLNITDMEEGARNYEGTHNFERFCDNSKQEKECIRQIDYCRLFRNNIFKADFMPQESYYLEVHGKGFLRYQIRYMMGALLDIGKGDLSLAEQKSALNIGGEEPVAGKAPASGLNLHKIVFDQG
ncbi:MAG: tRNA pseudouridine(38-40) synthase TruA [Fulvivirga sp.]|nr:tRNA pseudouridine(38-40) synthase TruA [Fulvivirga sp.]